MGSAGNFHGLGVLGCYTKKKAILFSPCVVFLICLPGFSIAVIIQIKLIQKFVLKIFRQIKIINSC